MSKMNPRPTSQTSRSGAATYARLECRMTNCDEPAIEQTRSGLCLRHIGEAASDYRELIKAAPTYTPPQESRGLVYWLRVGDLIKVGRTANMRQRLPHYPSNDTTVLALEPVGARSTARELEIITKLAPHKARGREWFHAHPEVMAEIDRALERYGDPQSLMDR